MMLKLIYKEFLKKNYLRVNQINTENVKQDVSELNSNVIINSYEGNKELI